MPQIPKPTLQSLFDGARNSIFSTLFVSQPATVKTYDADKRLATIELNYILAPVALDQPQPTLKPRIKVKVPVLQMWNKKGGMVVPINVGDKGLAVFVDREYSGFLAGREAHKPKPLGKHQDCFFISGFHPYTDVLPTDNTRTHLGYEDTVIRIGEKIALYNAKQDFFNVVTDVLTNLIDVTNALSQSIQQTSTIANTLANAMTIPAAIGTPLTMSPATIAQAQAAKAQLDAKKTEVDTFKNNLSQGKQNLSDLLEAK